MENAANDSQSISEAGRHEVALNIQEHLNYQEHRLSQAEQLKERRELAGFLQETGQLPALSIDWAKSNFSEIDEDTNGTITAVELLKVKEDDSYDRIMVKGVLLNYQAIEDSKQDDCEEPGLTKEELKAFVDNRDQEKNSLRTLKLEEETIYSLPPSLVDAATQKLGEGAYAAAQRLLPNGTLSEIKSLCETLNEEYARATGDTTADRRNMKVGHRFINEENLERIFSSSQALQSAYPDLCWKRPKQN